MLHTDRTETDKAGQDELKMNCQEHDMTIPIDRGRQTKAGTDRGRATQTTSRAEIVYKDRTKPKVESPSSTDRVTVSRPKG